jgi:hypothetical protein
MEPPTRQDLMDEVVRLTAENERLNRLVKSQRPELEALRNIEVRLRDYLDNGARSVAEVHQAVQSLLPGYDDLPKFAELLGILSDGKDRVDAAITEIKSASSEAAK